MRQRPNNAVRSAAGEVTGEEEAKDEVPPGPQPEQPSQSREAQGSGLGDGSSRGDRGLGPSAAQVAAVSRQHAWEARSRSKPQMDQLLAAAPAPAGSRQYDAWGSLPALRRRASTSETAAGLAGGSASDGEEIELAIIEAGRLLAASGRERGSSTLHGGSVSRDLRAGRPIEAGRTASARLKQLVRESTPQQALHGALVRLIPDASGFLPLESVAARLRQLGIKQLPDELVRLASVELGVGHRETSDTRFLIDSRQLAEFLLSGLTPSAPSRADDRDSRRHPGRDEAAAETSVARLASRCSAAIAALVHRTAAERVEDGVRVVDIKPAFRFLSERGTDVVSPHDLHTQLFRLGALRCDPAGAAPSDYVLREPGRGTAATTASLPWVERAAVERLFGEIFGPSALQRALDSRHGAKEAGTVEEDWAIAARPAFDFGQFARWAMPLSPRLAEVRERLKRAIRRQAMRGGGLFDPKLVFARLDADGSGTIDASELRAALGPDVLAELSPTDLGTLIQSMDSNGDGQIELRELVQLLFEAGET